MVSTLDLSQSLLGLYRNGQTHLVAMESGPPPRTDGYVIGTPGEGDSPAVSRCRSMHVASHGGKAADCELNEMSRQHLGFITG